MEIIILITILTTAAAAGGAVVTPADEHELHFVTFVHRHGDRSPVGSYPTDPYGEESLWNNGWGQLTTRGKQNAYALGKWLRNRYSDFLPMTYDEKDYQVVSTDVSRTLMSAYLVLAGLYEPTGHDVWNEKIKWQPIPVHTTPGSLDKLLAASKPCPKHTKLQVELMQSGEITSQIDNSMVKEVIQHAGYNSSDIFTNFFLASTVYDSLNIQNENGFQLPKWSQDFYPQPLRSLSSLMLRLTTYTQSLQRLSCGLLVEEILQNFRSKALGTLTKKIWQYSAHDITIVALRQCLGLKATDAPPYASALIFELSSKNNEFYVKLLYKTNEQLTTMFMPGCSEFCPLSKFGQLVAPVIPQDWEAECYQ